MDLFQSNSGDAENSNATGGGISRRSVLKVGAHAAWAVPLVQVVAAAPAVAASGRAGVRLLRLCGTGTRRQATEPTRTLTYRTLALDGPLDTQ